MTTHYIISDLHLADGSRRDDFKKNRTKFKNFLRMVKKQKARHGGQAQLVIAGDFLELLQSSPVDIIKTYSDILNDLIAIQSKIIIGNHDHYLHHFSGLNFLYDSYCIPRHGRQAGTRIFIQHGHQFDQFNDPKRLMQLGNFAAIAGGFIEDIHPDLDERAIEFLEFLREQTQWLPFWTPGTTTKQYLSRGGDFSEYLRGAKKLLKNYDHVILGHTHKPGTAFKGKYLNSGSWTSQKPSYVEVNHNGDCTLRYWPSKRPVKKILDRKTI